MVNVFYINVVITHHYFIHFIKVFDGGVAIIKCWRLSLVNVFYINVVITHHYFIHFIKIFDGGIAVIFNGFQGIINTLHLPGHGIKTVKKIKENKQVVNFTLSLYS